MGCKYEGCLNGDKHNGYCEFHSYRVNHSIPPERFAELLQKQIDEENCNFAGYKFPHSINFHDKTFNSFVNFENAEFHGKISFSKTKFLHGVSFLKAKFFSTVDFSNTKYSKVVRFKGLTAEYSIDFTEAEFRAENIDFSHLRLQESNVIFKDAKFFNGNVDFSNSSFGNVDFKNAKFCCFANTVTFERMRANNGDILFSDVEIAAFKTIFRGTEVQKGSAQLNFKSIYAETIDFAECKFIGGGANFSNSKLVGDHIMFQDCDFSGGHALFYDTYFEANAIEFTGSKFTGGDALFTFAKFIGGNIVFERCEFAHRINFVENTISDGLDFVDLKLSQQTKFYFRNPQFLTTQSKPPRILFDRVHFNPLLTFFDGIKIDVPGNKLPLEQRPIFLFRYCQLKDVHFSNCDMSMISFFTSPFFEQAHFVSVKWYSQREKIFRIFAFNRSIIIEDEILRKQKENTLNNVERNKHVEFYKSRLLNGYSKLATLYRLMKTAADNAKDYQQGSMFYFSEFEVKKYKLRERLKNEKWVKRYSYKWINLFLYYIYKVIAGYGEKPHWSLNWLCFFSFFVFPMIHLFNGIIPQNKTIINYDFMRSFPNLIQLFKDYITCIGFTLVKIIPLNYLPIPKLEFAMQTMGVWDYILSISNSVVLALLIIFTAMGLKRHFRRF
ncbi:MAG: hypothetical protein V3V99_07950 [candidate division Zixibacteria bacterium]